MNSLFLKAFDLVLKHEGGFVNDPRDPGGKTRFGISDRRDGVVDGMADLNADGKGDVAIENLTKEQAGAIYKESYWNACKCDHLPASVAIALFDSAVNCGNRQAVRFLQRAIRVVDDGVIGPVTIAKANDVDACDVVVKMMTERQAHYAALSTWKVYGRGWTRRVIDVAHVSMMLEGA